MEQSFLEGPGGGGWGLNFLSFLGVWFRGQGKMETSLGWGNGKGNGNKTLNPEPSTLKSR